MTAKVRIFLMFTCVTTVFGCRTSDEPQTSDAMSLERELGLSLEASIQKGKDALDVVADGADTLRRAGSRDEPSSPSVIRVSSETLSTLQANVARLRETMLELYTKLDNPNAQPAEFFAAVPREVFEDVVVRNLWRLISEAEGSGGLQAGLLLQVDDQVAAYLAGISKHRANPETKVNLEALRRRSVKVLEQAVIAGNVVLHELSTWRYRERSATSLSKVLTTFCAGKEGDDDEKALLDAQANCGAEGKMAGIIKSFASEQVPGVSVSFSNYAVPEFRRVHSGVFAGRASYHSWPEVTMTIAATKGQMVTEPGPELRVTEQGQAYGEAASSAAIASWQSDCQKKLTRLSQETRRTETRFLAAAVCLAPELDCVDKDCDKITAHSRILFYYLSRFEP